MTNATRYLCAAAYLSVEYTNQVIGELISSHRAVAPSVGVDLVPIVRHCLRARKINLIRDLILSPLLLLFAVFVVKAISAIASGPSIATYGAPVSASPNLGSLVPVVLVVIAVIATQVAYVYVRNRTLCDELAAGAGTRGFHPQSAEVEARIGQIESAQQGNVLLYSSQNPFLGTGRLIRTWSIPIELRRAADRKRGTAWMQQRAQNGGHDYAPVDPVELHKVLCERLLSLKDEQLPPNERLTGLEVHDQIIGPGRLPWNSVLIDQNLKIPFSQASPPALDAVIRHPQAGVRYFQRVSVCDEGQPVWAGRDKVLEGWDQDISASAFVYVAVEGRMFYLEFVTTAMPPIQARWYAVDELPRLSGGRFITRVLTDSAASIFGDAIRAPVRAYRSVRASLREKRTYRDEAMASRDNVHANLGARLSVRELGAASDPGSYIQQLDSEKYTKLVERLVIDTVLDFLSARGVDTTSFAGSAATVVASNVVMGNTFNAAAAVGVTGDVHQNTSQPQPAQ